MVGENQRRVNVEWASELQTEPAYLRCVGFGVTSVRYHGHRIDFGYGAK
ncbi:hypothetical protein BRIN106911_14945 [Brevibacillus invocatus]